MPNEMEHDDQSPDADMIKQVLQKIIDEMDGLEANRIHPKMSAMKLEVETPKENMQEGGVEEPTEDGLDPEILSQLMDKAGSADETGELPEDKESVLPPEIAMAVKKKKGLLK